MRTSFLCSSAALIALLVASPFSARAEMETTLGGFVAFRAGAFDNDLANPSRRDFSQESEIHISVVNTADNGMQYGGKVELLTSTSDTSNSDEVGLFMQGDWGRVELGDDDGASDQLSVMAPVVGIGQLNGRYLDYVPFSSRPAGNVKDTGGGMIKPLDTDDSTKITYYTPKYMGWQAGVSYAPEASSGNSGEEVQLFDNVGNQRDFFEYGLRYSDKLGDFRVTTGFAGGFASAKDGSGREDVTTWGLGARVYYKSFGLGGGYVDNGDSNNAVGLTDDNETAWNFGATYRDGPWGFAVNYLTEDYGLQGGRTTEGGTYDAVVFGTSYRIVRGLTTGADLAFYDRDKVTGTNDSGYVFVLETKASF